jgi:hypothetical protein
MAQMVDGIKIDDKLWSRFAEEAKNSNKDPVRLLAELLREHLDQRERERVNRETIKTAKRSGLTQDDDIERMINDLRKKRLAKA